MELGEKTFLTLTKGMFRFFKRFFKRNKHFCKICGKQDVLLHSLDFGQCWICESCCHAIISCASEWEKFNELIQDQRYRPLK